MDSTTSSNSNYVMLEGLSIEMAASEFEVYLTPDIDINKNLSMESVTSSIRGETGAPMVKHLHTFSQEETDEEIDLSNLSICTTEEERDEDVKNKIRIRRNDTSNTDSPDQDEEDTENNSPPRTTYRRQQDSFSRKEQVQNQRQILSSIVPPAVTCNDEINPPRASYEATISSSVLMKEKKGDVHWRHPKRVGSTKPYTRGNGERE